MLEVELVSYESDDYGNTAVIPGFGFLADVFPEPYLVKWEIADGVARSAELPGVAVPEEIFAGVAGIVSVHDLRAPRHWTEAEIEASRAAAARIAGLV